MIRASAVPGNACLGRSELIWLRVGDSPEGSLETEWAILSMMPAPCGCILLTKHTKFAGIAARSTSPNHSRSSLQRISRSKHYTQGSETASSISEAQPAVPCLPQMPLPSTMPLSTWTRGCRGARHRCDHSRLSACWNILLTHTSSLSLS